MNQNTIDQNTDTAHEPVTFGGLAMTRAEALAVMHACEWEQIRIDAWERRQAEAKQNAEPARAEPVAVPEAVTEEKPFCNMYGKPCDLCGKAHTAPCHCAVYPEAVTPHAEPEPVPEAMPEPATHAEPATVDASDAGEPAPVAAVYDDYTENYIAYATSRGMSPQDVTISDRAENIKKPHARFMAWLTKTKSEIDDLETVTPEPVAPRPGADAYLAEPVSYGGEVVSRGAMIADLQTKGATPAMVDAYVIGHAVGTAAQAEVDAEAGAQETVTENENPTQETVTDTPEQDQTPAQETVTDASDDADPDTETDTPKTFTGSSYATYCPEDDKLRLYCGRVPRPEYERLRREGWTATPKQSCAFVAVWTPTRENTALEYADDGIIDDEDQSPTDRAADRAERFAGYRDKRRDEAHGSADTYEAGPKLLGYQSAALAERKARALERTADRSVNLWGKAEYWQHRTAGVIGHALHVSAPGVRMGRIKILEAEQRKLEKEGGETVGKEQRAFDLWHALANGGKLPRMDAPFYALHNIDEKPAGDDGKITMDQYRLGVALMLAGYGTGPYRALRAKTVTPVLAAAAFLEEHRTRPLDWQPCGRWYQHVTLRLAYENQMLEAQGGRAAHVEMFPGGWIGERQVMKVNKSSVTGRVVSVALKVPAVTGWNYGIKNVPGTDYALFTLDTERLASSVYRAPTDAELEAFNAGKKADKKAKADATPKAAPLVNLSDADAELLQSVWNAGRRSSFGNEPRQVMRLTQAEYSERVKCARNYETAEIIGGGRVRSATYSRSDFPAVAKVREHHGSVIVLTDKPQKAMTAEQWTDPAPAAREWVRERLATLESAIKKSWQEKHTEEESAVLNKAAVCGLAFINSTTQYGWTDAGRAWRSNLDQKAV